MKNKDVVVTVRQVRRRKVVDVVHSKEHGESMLLNTTSHKPNGSKLIGRSSTRRTDELNNENNDQISIILLTLITTHNQKNRRYEL